MDFAPQEVPVPGTREGRSLVAGKGHMYEENAIELSYESVELIIDLFLMLVISLQLRKPCQNSE